MTLYDGPAKEEISVENTEEQTQTTEETLNKWCFFNKSST